MLIPLLLAMIAMARPGADTRALRQIGMVLLGVLRRPMVLGLIAGLAVSLLGLVIPAPVGRLLSAAMPMFGIYTIFAQEAGHEGMASIAQLAATVLAFFTLNALLVWIV